MNLIWLLLHSSRSNVAIAIMTGLISGASSARLIALINQALITGDSSDNLVWYFIGLAVVALLGGAISQFLLIELAQEAVYKLRLRISQGILSAPLRHLEELGANRLLATLTEDVQAISGSVFAITFICIDLAVIVGCMVYLSWLSLTVFTIAAGSIALAFVTVQILIKKTYRFFASAREEEDRLFKHFRSITDGIKELKLHAMRRQIFFFEELQVSAATSRDYRKSALKTGTIATLWGQLLFFGFVGLVVFGVPKWVSVTPSVLAAYVLTATYLLNPLKSILERLPILFNASVAVRKVERMGLALESQAEPNLAIRSPSILDRTSLELDRVTHSYRGEREDSRFVLGPLLLTFDRPELIFIIGGNGSGKSTLAKLITGLYVPEAGEIRLDGKPISQSNLEWYRQHFSAIFSDFYLFERFLGIESCELEQIARKYLEQLHLEDKVRVKEGALSTTELSQGQRKRLALLTAYLEDRPIYLFDEWASDQDPFFRDVFYKHLLPELKQRGKMILVISHDDRYFHLADRVIKLDYGKVEYDRRQSPNPDT